MESASHTAAFRESPLGRTLGIAAVALGGTVVGAVALTHALDPHEPFAGIVLSIFVILGTTLPSCGIAVWLSRSQYTTRDVLRVLAWSLLGGLPLAALVVVVAGYQQSHGVYIHDLAFVVATVMGVGLVGGAFTGIHDVEREQRAHAYRTVDDQFTTVVEAAPVAIIAVDDDGVVRLWNRAATDLLGYDRDDVLGQSCPVAPLGTDGECCCIGTFDGPREFECERADGSRIAVECRNAELSIDQDDDCRYVAIISDVTAENRRRQRLTVLHRILRHNLRTGINVAQGNAKLLASGADTPQETQSADAILDVTDDLLALSEKAGRIERTLSESQEHSVTLDLADLVRRRVDDAMARHPHADMTLHAPTDAWIQAGYAISAAITEALDNAVEHDDSDTPQVEITIDRDPGDEMVTLTIADTGPGIPPSEREAVEAGQETQTRHVTGLGLWLQSWIVSGYGGTLSFDDNDPVGTVVTMQLPATPRPDSQPVQGTPHGTHANRSVVAPADSANDSTSVERTPDEERRPPPGTRSNDPPST